MSLHQNPKETTAASFSFANAFYNQTLTADGVFENPLTGQKYQICKEELLYYMNAVTKRLERELAANNDSFKNPLDGV